MILGSVLGFDMISVHISENGSMGYGVCVYSYGVCMSIHGSQRSNAGSAHHCMKASLAKSARSILV